VKKWWGTVTKARKLRREMSPPELLLWQVLRTRPGGLKFRRQHPVGPYVIDFYCAKIRLAVEVDGAAHDMGSNPAHDAQRDRWLENHGVRSVRLLAADIFRDMEAAVTRILTESGKPG
jgi:very-short-patch-repair endonuclease